MKLFNILVLTSAVIAGKNDGRNEDVPADVNTELKKACKAQIKNKVDSEKFKEKLNKCMEKKTAKYLKREEKKAAAADRVTMKEQINELKQEKAEVKAERTMCKAACQALADQSTKQNCVDYWTTVSREKIQTILEQVGDKRDRNDPAAYCLTDAGLTGEETTCKQHASEYCDSIGQMRPSKNFRDCRSSCLGDCMVSEQCDWAPPSE